jgi:hypothetical protein
MASKKLRSIRNHVFRYARALDVARWNYHFEDGSEREVLKALAVYKNADGGYGHGIEPDNQNPHSTPMGAWAAVRVLRELQFPEIADNLMEDLRNYLLHTDAFDGTRWQRTVPSNNDWPRAPWWEHNPDEAPTVNPTAELAGFLLRTAKCGTRAYTSGEHILSQILPDLKVEELEAHELVNVVALLEDVQAVGREYLLPEGFPERVAEQVHKTIEQNTDAYTETAYIISPKFYIHGKQSPYYENNKDICTFYAKYLEDSVGPDGAWGLTWNWGAQEMPFHARRDWQGSLIVDNMLFLQGMKE